MDRDVALTLNTKLSAINTALQNIVNGIVNSAETNRSIPDVNNREIEEIRSIEEPEPVETESVEPEPVEPETRKKK